MFRQTIALIFLLSGLAGAGCNQTVQQRPDTQPNPAPRTGSQTTSNSSNVSQVELANLRADIQSLDRRVRELDLMMEELHRENRQLRTEVEQGSQSQSEGMRGMVRREQLDSVASEMRERMRQANAEQTRQIMSQVSEQIERLGQQTQAAIDAVARSVNARPSGGSPSRRESEEFSEDFPKEGITYTVRSGDTLSSIASRHNSTIRDIQNANQISNPARIQVGQVLFVPQREN